ncbi:SIR2 family NAD-dependent protein deacylase [Sediminicola arcticus]|jgi:NAD-dependent deacetylase|uniref:NAD-dependent protein deacylase n=1 Tax=Sediminicola arcticus TaxID=1574308 RepID=A0ABV2SXX9_9FLAO
MRKKIVVLTGAGVSAESGLKTFRDSNGLWEGHDVMEVATPQGYANNPTLVLNFYNQRRKQLFDVSPNKAHIALVALEKFYDVSIITQNVDDLHERAGSSMVLHLHGELLKVRSSIDPDVIIDWKNDLNLGDTCNKGSQLRPHIVWFGEEVPMLDKAIEITQNADIIIIIGTSMQVYPAASLVQFTPTQSPIYFIDPKPNISPSAFENLIIVQKTAAIGVPTVVADLIDRAL